MECPHSETIQIHQAVPERFAVSVLRGRNGPRNIHLAENLARSRFRSSKSTLDKITALQCLRGRKWDPGIGYRGVTLLIRLTEWSG